MSVIFNFLILVFVLKVQGKWDELKLKIESDPSFSIKFPAQPNFLKDGPIGHLEELGKQRPSLGHIPEHFEAPTPRFLWENYIQHFRPAVFRNLLNGSPALSLWTDEYLAKEYGDLEVLVEKKFEDRKSEPKRMRIDAFLRQYRDQNWYVVSILPDKMKKDVKIPKPLMCSSLRRNMMELNLWIGTRGTRSMLHFDADNILHCLVSGRKDWILIHPRYRHLSELSVDEPGQGSGFSVLSVDHVDVFNNPDISLMPWEHVTLYAGDCLFLPPQYMHQVRSYNRSISATYLVFPHANFTDDDCANVDLDSYENMENLFVFWGYQKDQETVDMGYRNPNQQKQTLIKGFSTFHIQSFNFKEFFYVARALGTDLFEKEELFGNIFQSLDANKDGVVHLDEIKNADIEIIKGFCRQSEDPHGPTKTYMNTNEKLSNGSSEFAPRPESHYIEANRSRSFLVRLMKNHGTKGSISFPKFSSVVTVRKGTAAEAFVVLDLDMNGIFTLKEFKALSKPQLKKFYGLGCVLEGSNDEEDEGPDNEEDAGPGNEEEEEEDEEDARPIYSDPVIKVFKQILQSLNEKKMEPVDQAQFALFFKKVKNAQPNLDVEFLFKVLDRNGKGHLTAQDINQIFESNEPEPEIPEDEPEGVKRARNQTSEEPIFFSKLFRLVLKVMLMSNSEEKIKVSLNAEVKDEL